MFFNKYFFILLIIFLLPIHFGLGIYIYLSHDLPSTEDVRNVELQVPLKIFTSDGKLIGEYGEIHRTKLEFSDAHKHSQVLSSNRQALLVPS